MIRLIRPAILFSCVLTLAAPFAMAGEPNCDVTKTCLETNDNYAPATSRPKIQVQPSSKVLETLKESAPLASAILDLNGGAFLIFHDQEDERQLRISQDGKLNNLITKTDPTAHNGKDQVLYRGQCVKG